MKRTLFFIALCISVMSNAQRLNVLDEVKANPQKSYGTDYPYTFDAPALTKAPLHQPLCTSRIALLLDKFTLSGT